MKVGLYTNCKLVEGIRQSIIVDLYRQQIYFVPLHIKRYLDSDVSELDETERADYYECISFLLEEQLVHVYDPVFSASKLNTQVSCHSRVSNCTVLISTEELNDVVLTRLSDTLDDCGVQALLLVASPEIGVGHIKKVAGFFENSKARAIQIALAYQKHTDSPGEDVMCNGRITDIIIYDSPVSSSAKHKRYETVTERFVEVSYQDLYARNNIKDNLTPNIRFYTESLKYNPFYYKKAIVDVSGNIYSDLSFTNILGSILSDDLQTVIQCDPSLEYAFVPKTKISVCKDCELRNVCPDNRIPQKRKNGTWYHTLECDYNPYMGKWKDEDGYRSLAECGIINDDLGFKQSKIQ